MYRQVQMNKKENAIASAANKALLGLDNLDEKHLILNEEKIANTIKTRRGVEWHYRVSFFYPQ